MTRYAEEGCRHPLSISIKSLRAQHEGAEISVGIRLEAGEYSEQKNLLISAEQYCELRPTKGPIDELLYEALETAAALCAAIRCGENLLSYGSNTAQMLAQKLVRHGFGREVAAAAAERLCERGLIDERRDLEREVEKCIRKLWGAKRIQNHLWSRGFSGDVMAELPMLLEEIDFVANCRALIRKHYGEAPTDADERRRMLASLGRYGYSLSEIRSALKEE